MLATEGQFGARDAPPMSGRAGCANAAGRPDIRSETDVGRFVRAHRPGAVRHFSPPVGGVVGYFDFAKSL